MLHLAQNVSNGDTNGGSDDSDSNTIGQTIQITTGQVNNNVTPHYGQAHQGVETNKYDEYCVGRLQLSP